jgi:hypothetical protein
MSSGLARTVITTSLSNYCTAYIAYITVLNSIVLSETYLLHMKNKGTG